MYEVDVGALELRTKRNARGVVGCPPQKLAESILAAVCSEEGVVVTRAGDNINLTLSSPTEPGGMCAVLNHPPAGAGEIRRSQKPHIQNRPRPSRPSAEPPPRPEEPEAPRYTRPQANYRKRDVYKAKDRRGLLAEIKILQVPSPHSHQRMVGTNIQVTGIMKDHAH